MARPCPPQTAAEHRLRSLLFIWTLVLCGFALPAALNAQTPENRPNIIFILSDDHRWDYLGSAGHPFVRTPHLDRLAREGARFTNAFVTTSLCSPSRASFLTGRYPQGHGVQNNFTKWDESNVTFLEPLKRAGYRTAFIGKWHMPGGIPDLPGADLFITFDHVAGQGAYYGTPYIVNGERIPLGEEVMPGITAEGYITKDLTDMALAFIDQQLDTPFVLYLSHKAAHLPMTPPEETKGRHSDIPIAIPEEADNWVSFANGNYVHLLWGQLRTYIRAYAETIEAMDAEIGRLLTRLDELGLTDNTIVVYAGDNGYLWGEHRQIDKRWAYEDSIRIPFLVRYPDGLSDPGEPVEDMVLNVDLAPTLLDLAGLDIPDIMDGESLLPRIRGEAPVDRADWLYSYFADYPYRVPSLNALRTERYKLVRYDRGKSPELYDLDQDPEERANLAQDPAHRSVFERLSSRMDDLIRDISSTEEAAP